MPPKKPATLSAPGPSNTGQGTADDEQEKGASWRPTILAKRLNKDDIMTFAFFYNRYDYEGRPLSKEEVCDMWGKKFDTEPPRYVTLKGLFDELDRVNGEFRDNSENLMEGYTEFLRAEADSLVDHLRNDNKKDFGERFEIYDGL